MSDPAPVESLTAEQAAAEIAQHRAAPVAAWPGDARMNALYQRAHAASTPAAPAPGTVAATTATIAAIRTALNTERDNTPRARELNAQLQAQYKVLHPEPASTEPEQTLAERFPLDPQHGLAWDTPGVEAYKAAAPSDAVRATFDELQGEITGALRSGVAMTQPACDDALLAELNGNTDAFDAMMDHMDAALDEGRRLGRQADIDILVTRGLLHRPRIVKALAAIGAALTPAGAGG